MLPIASIVTLQLKLFTVLQNQSRASLSASPRESRDMPVSVGALIISIRSLAFQQGADQERKTYLPDPIFVLRQIGNSQAVLSLIWLD